MQRYRNTYKHTEYIEIPLDLKELVLTLPVCGSAGYHVAAFYDEDTVTDQPMRQIVAELIREKALRCLEKEIPHGIAVTIEKMKWRGNLVDIEATIICERDSHKGIIIGKNGDMLKRIGTWARKDMEQI